MKNRNNKIKGLLLIAILALFFNSKSQTVAFNNNLNCDVTVGYEIRDTWSGGCNVCDWGSFTILANNNVPYTVAGSCSGPSNDACIWVSTIGGASVGSNHGSLTCCGIPNNLSGAAPAGCSSSGTWNVIYAFPGSWSINP